MCVFLNPHVFELAVLSKSKAKRGDLAAKRQVFMEKLDKTKFVSEKHNSSGQDLS